MMHLLSTENTIITPKSAMSYLANNTFEYQRPIGPANVSILANKMKRGVYMGANIVLGIINGKMVIADGQHTLSAIVESGISQPATIKKIHCDSEWDLTLLYQQYDGGKTRSIRDHARAEAGLLNIEWPAKTVSTVIAGAAVIVWGMHTPKEISKDEKVRLLREFLEEGTFVYEVATSKVGDRMFMRGHVVAVMMLSYRISKDDAWVFWPSVRDGEMLKKTSPAYHLREFLSSTDTRGMRKTASRKEFFVKCCKAWNAYRSGAEMGVLRYNSSEKIPELI
jgi:hypothetical protein